MTYEAAENYCQQNGGGHLASYGSLGEQKDVETHFIKRGLLLPKWHRWYWFGLSSTAQTYPKFTWKDFKVQAPGEGRLGQEQLGAGQGCVRSIEADPARMLIRRACCKSSRRHCVLAAPSTGSSSR